jgi:hypothetical protein
MKDNASAHAPHLSTEQQGAKSRKYRQAAAGYFIYGLIYLLGAMHLAGVGEGPDAGWVWFIVGAAMVVAFPILIWMELKWVTRILAFLVAIRVLGLIRVAAQEGDAGVELPWGGDIRLTYGAILFAVIAATECYMLVRAGWDV